MIDLRTLEPGQYLKYEDGSQTDWIWFGLVLSNDRDNLRVRWVRKGNAPNDDSQLYDHGEVAGPNGFSNIAQLKEYCMVLSGAERAELIFSGQELP